MTSRLTTLLLMFGLLSLVTARPVTHENAEKEGTTTSDINDLLSDKDLEDLFKILFPSSKAAKEQQGFSITLPGGNTFDWGKEQGRRVPFGNGKTQGTVQDVKNAKEQGFSITLPDGNTFDWGKEQGRRVPFGNAKTQGTIQNAKNAEEQGLSITLPGGNTFDWGKEQGRRIPLPAKEQSYTGNSLEDLLDRFLQPSKTVKEQGRRVPIPKEQTHNMEDLIKSFLQPSKNVKEQGFSITLPDGNTVELGQEQGRRIGWGHEQGRRVGWGEEQGRRVPFSKEQGRIVPFYGSDIMWSKEQGIKVPIPSSKTQSAAVNPSLLNNYYYRYPYSEEQGRRVPFAKQQSIYSLRYPYYYGYNQQQDLSKELINELMKDKK